MNRVRYRPGRWIKMLGRWDRGQALIEAALAMPLMMVLLIGAVEVGRLAYASIEVSNAARAGAAYGAQNGTTAADATGIQTAAQNDAGNLVGLVTATSSTTGICSSGAACTGSGGTCSNTDCSTPGDHIETFLTVSTSATVSSLIHIPAIPTSITLQGNAVQQVLQ